MSQLPVGTDGTKNKDRTEVVQSVSKRLANCEHMGLQKKRILREDEIFDPNDPKIREDIVCMIVQYLQDSGYTASALTVQDEANVKMYEEIEQRAQLRAMRRAILEGEWNEVEKLITKNTFKNQKAFMYSAYKQQYLELLEKQEYQRAFTHLTKRLKPLERYAGNPEEFKDLCFLLTCKNIQDAPSFKNWDGSKGNSRERVVEQFEAMFHLENRRLYQGGHTVDLPPNRLLHLLRQSVAYQMEFTRYHPKVAPKISTLLEDYSPFLLPNSLKKTLAGHTANVKCVEFVGEEGLTLASGSSDCTVNIWESETGTCLHTLRGHTSRVWDVSSAPSGLLLASASGDATTKLWDLGRQAVVCTKTLKGHEGDVYTVHFHPAENHIATGGYDRVANLWDVRTGQLVKKFIGHSASVSHVIFNPYGNLIISGSKDNTVKFWDITSGLCIKTYSTYLGEVTSVAMSQNGSLLLTSSKDNSNRLWDVRTARPIRRFKGHQNTAKNFLRASFGPNELLIVGPSEDEMIYIWDIMSGDLLQTLKDHTGTVYTATWNPHQSLLASCGDDGMVKTWCYDESVSLFGEDE